MLNHIYRGGRLKRKDKPKVSPISTSAIDEIKYLSKATLSNNQYLTNLPDLVCFTKFPRPSVGKISNPNFALLLLTDLRNFACANSHSFCANGYFTLGIHNINIQSLNIFLWSNF